MLQCGNYLEERRRHAQCSFGVLLVVLQSMFLALLQGLLCCEQITVLWRILHRIVGKVCCALFHSRCTTVCVDSYPRSSSPVSWKLRRPLCNHYSLECQEVMPEVQYIVRQSIDWNRWHTFCLFWEVGQFFQIHRKQSMKPNMPGIAITPLDSVAIWYPPRLGSAKSLLRIF